MTSADALTRMGQLICRWLPKYQSVLFCFRMSRCVYIVHVQALKSHAILKCAQKKKVLHFSACSRCVSSMSSVDRWATSQVPPLQIFVGVDMGWLQAVELPKTGQLSCFGRALRWESWKSSEVGLTKVCEGLHIIEITRTFVMLHMLPFQSHFALESGSRWCSFQALLKMVLDGFVHLGFQRWGARVVPFAPGVPQARSSWTWPKRTMFLMSSWRKLFQPEQSVRRPRQHPTNYRSRDKHHCTTAKVAEVSQDKTSCWSLSQIAWFRSISFPQSALRKHPSKMVQFTFPLLLGWAWAEGIKLGKR